MAKMKPQGLAIQNILGSHCLSSLDYEAVHEYLMISNLFS